MTQQHTIVAKERAVRERTRKELTALHHAAQHPPTFMGSTKEMQSTNEEVPSEAPEINLPPMRASELLERVRTILVEAWDLMATRDRSNMDAKADIVVDGRTYAADVPVSTLLSLEKAFTDLRTLISGMPVRDPSKLWKLDGDLGFFRSPEERRPKTRKTIKPIELYPATDRHPAQVQALSSDEIVGQFITVSFSGALSVQEKQSYVDRVNRLIDAVRAARAEANRTEVTDVSIAADLLAYVFPARVEAVGASS